jgi:hypothetical protein
VCAQIRSADRSAAPAVVVKRVRVDGIGPPWTITMRCMASPSIDALHFLQRQPAKKLFDGDRTASL